MTSNITSNSQSLCLTRPDQFNKVGFYLALKKVLRHGNFQYPDAIDHTWELIYKRLGGIKSLYIDMASIAPPMQKDETLNQVKDDIIRLQRDDITADGRVQSPSNSTFSRYNSPRRGDSTTVFIHNPEAGIVHHKRQLKKKSKVNISRIDGS